jgi:hypothetical protein
MLSSSCDLTSCFHPKLAGSYTLAAWTESIKCVSQLAVLLPFSLPCTVRHQAVKCNCLSTWKQCHELAYTWVRNSAWILHTSQQLMQVLRNRWSSPCSRCPATAAFPENSPSIGPCSWQEGRTLPACFPSVGCAVRKMQNNLGTLAFWNPSSHLTHPSSTDC